jgi:hypothetical protein
LDEGAGGDFAGRIVDATGPDPEPDAVDPRLDVLDDKVGEP